MANRTPTKTAEPKAASGPRAVHLLILPSSSSDTAILNVETFTGEIAARRELDNRPGWKYLALVPGEPYRPLEAEVAQR